MLIGDSVLLQKGKKIFRPSDIGTPVEIAGTWTLRFNNGTLITTTGATQFKELYQDATAENWITLDNMSRFTSLGYREPFTVTEKKWNSEIELSDYTSKKGKFDLGDVNFAKFAGAFIKSCKKVAARPNAYAFDKVKFADYIDYAKTIYPQGTADEDKKYFYLNKCWVDELLDVLFNFTDVTSIPDELMFKFSEEWIEGFYNGFFSGCYYDKPNKCYVVLFSYEQFLADLNILMMRIHKSYQVAKKTDSEENEVFVVKFPDSVPPLSIIDGFENEAPKLVYDIGSGEFNASGIMIKG